ncbi:hypothetical protein DDF62_17040 [Caulobacter radicis]|uniref:hypothetical protein n=1 Tax=Caulobacter radicis TaxID=2172650 RepID=UPI000D578D5B|nr:hypothetical protein [Caulobacter radicis]PVM86762.1 hypothetical protein DDF62_17040 [Caulobacter radicis]
MISKTDFLGLVKTAVGRNQAEASTAGITPLDSSLFGNVAGGYGSDDDLRFSLGYDDNGSQWDYTDYFNESYEDYFSTITV